MRADFVRQAMERYERALIAYARRMTGDLDAARDVVQETFVRLWSQDQKQVEDRLAEWLFVVCRRRAIDRSQKERAMRSREQAVSTRESVAPADVEQRDDIRAVTRLTDRLPDKQREALHLRFQRGFSYRQIGEVMNETEGQVAWLLHQGLKKLRERMRATEVSR